VVSDKSTVWDLVAEYAATQSGPFTSQEVLSWFRRHAPSKANERTVRTHVRGACWNVGDRSQFSSREPFLTRIDRGLFRRATSEEIVRWRAGPTSTPAPIDATAEAPTGAQPTPSAEWHTEASVQASLVTALAADGWRIVSVAKTATKEHGIDVIAARDGQTVGVEVKGYPSRDYADPKRAGEVKRSSPSNQAGHWYAQAVLAAMRIRGKEPTWRSVIVLPDFPRYRTLFSATAASLAAAQIEVWWLDPLGTLLDA
jgi:hypothetical protein